MTTRTTPAPATIHTVEPTIRTGDNEDDPALLIDELASRRLGRQTRKQAETVRTLVAMPAYNEEAYIAKTVLGAKQHADAVLVVDDGSKDDTVPIAEALGAIVVCHATNKGYGGALQTIFATARDLGAEELVIIDSDGQHSPGDIPRLLAELRRGNDVVIGSRFVEGSAGEITELRNGFGAYGRKAIEAIRIGGNGISAGAEILSQIRDLAVAGMPAGVRPAASEEPRYRGKRIAVVIPAYNEEDLIGEVLDGIPDYVAKVYAVNDGSADRTGAIIDAYAQHDPRIVPIHHNPNRGVGSAITSGYKRAVADGMDIAAVMAGDNQMDPAHLPSLLDPIIDGRAEYTKGNRLINEAYRPGLVRWLGHKDEVSEKDIGQALVELIEEGVDEEWSLRCRATVDGKGITRIGASLS